MIGREGPLAAVDRTVRAAARGRASVISLLGGAGLGKTLLCGCAVERAVAAGFVPVMVTGVQWESPFQTAALGQVLRPLRNVVRGRLSTRHRQVVDAVLGGEGAAGIDPFALSTATLACLVTAAERDPLLVVVDDAHWIDDLSAAVLGFALRRLFADRIAALVACRTDERNPFQVPGELVVLQPMSAAELADMMHELRPELPPMRGEVARELRDRAAGNPLVTAELAPLLEAAHCSGAVPLPDPLPLGERGRLSVGSRIAELSDSCRQALATVAAAGLQVALVPAALQTLGMDVSDLAPAVEAGVLRPGASVEFRHPLFRSAAYDGVSETDRRAIHRAYAGLNRGVEVERYARHLDAAGADSGQVADALEDAAHVLTVRAGPAAAAASWGRSAELTSDRRQRRRRAVRAANSYFVAGAADRCWDWLGAAMDPGTDDEHADPDPAVSAEALLLACTASVFHTRATDVSAVLSLAGRVRQMAAVDPDRAVEAYCMLSATLQNLGALKRAAELVLAASQLTPDVHERTRTHFLMFASNTITLTAGAAAATPVRILLPSEQIDAAVAADPGAMWWLAQTAGWQEDYGYALELCRAVLLALRRSGTLSWLPYALSVYAELLWHRGSSRAAWAAATEAVDLAEATDQDGLLGFSQCAAARVAATSDRGAEAERFLNAALQLVPDAPDSPVVLYAEHVWGLYELTRGRPGAAVQHLSRAHRLATTAGMAQPTVVPYLADYVEALVRTNDESGATVMMARLAADVERSGSRWARAVHLRCQALHEPGTSTSEDALRHSVDLLSEDQLNLPFERARSLLELGVQLRRAHRLTDARVTLRQAADAFTRFGATAWARRADAEHRAAGGRPATTTPAAGGLERLSAQQLQVVLAAAAGATNREVAASLFLSPKTVDYHLRRACAALGVRTRVELARLVAALPGQPDTAEN